MKKSKPKIDDTLADIIREEMAKSGMSNYRIGIEANVDHAVISRFVNKERSISLDVADRICKLLGLKLVNPNE